MLHIIKAVFSGLLALSSNLLSGLLIAFFLFMLFAGP